MARRSGTSGSGTTEVGTTTNGHVPAGRTLIATLDDACCPSVLTEVLDEHEAAQLAHGFAALADPVRLRLISLLSSAPTGETCVCDLVEPVGKSQPTVSHHLKVLADAGLIVGEKRGRWVWYAIVPERLEALRATLRPA